jgi:hypothetical protein
LHGNSQNIDGFILYSLYSYYKKHSISIFEQYDRDYEENIIIRNVEDPYQVRVGLALFSLLVSLMKF